MSQGFNPQASFQPLSVGNVVSAAVRLYRSHFKQYLGLACQAVLWAIIPIYGWAKMHTIYAIIARQAFGELVNQPEAITKTRNQLNPRLWTFLLAQILVGLILFGVSFGLSLVQNLILLISGFAFQKYPLLISFLALILTLAYWFGYLWFYARMFIPELPIAIENNVDAAQSISRSWELSKGHVWRLQAIIFIASLMTMPLIILAFIPFILSSIPIMIQASQNPNVTPNETVWGSLLVGILLAIIGMMVVSIMTMPFWQSIKAVIYYDLRSRREGLGLKLRDREI